MVLCLLLLILLQWETVASIGLSVQTVAHLTAQPSDVPTKQRPRRQREILTFWSDETEFCLSATNKSNAIGSGTGEHVNIPPWTYFSWI